MHTHTPLIIFIYLILIFNAVHKTVNMYNICRWIHPPSLHINVNFLLPHLLLHTTVYVFCAMLIHFFLGFIISSYLHISVDGNTILFRTKNLQTLEILQKFNELVSSQVKVEETELAGKKPVQTKSQKRR